MSEFKLNKAQLQSIKHGKGPLLIIAGAGTGKTTVITERIKYLVSNEFAKPNEILALTFTEKASKEMEERVDIAMPYGYTQMWISTFHSFCDRVLRDESLSIGISTSYKLMTTSETIRFIKNNLFEFDLKYFRPLGNPGKFVGALQQHFSRLQDEDISPDQYLNWVNAKLETKNTNQDEVEILELEKWVELANAYKKYEELKLDHGVFDFGDLIFKTLELFRKRPNVLKVYKEKFKYILVDEYQDTNISQNELVKILSGPAGNITVVADDDQAVYKWRGASVSNVIQFKKSFPEVKIITLTENYRSSQMILDKSYELIQHNNPNRLELVENIDKKLINKKGIKSENIEFLHASRGDTEADSVSEKILELIDLKSGKYNFSDISVLVRANNHSESIIRSFERHGIPHKFLGTGKLFQQPEILDLIAYLRILNDFEDNSSLFKVLTIDEFGISIKDVLKLLNNARKRNMSVFEIVESNEKLDISEDSVSKIQNVYNIIEGQLKLIKVKSAGELLYNFMSEAGIFAKLVSEESEKNLIKLQNISLFFEKIKSIEMGGGISDVFSVLDWIEIQTESGDSPSSAEIDLEGKDLVRIMTLHSSKGLEFPVVFVVNLVEGRFPSVDRKEKIPIPDEIVKESLPEGDYHIQEERRLFYVGMTRAKEKLYFTAANFYGDAKRQKKLSPFIFEALGEEAISEHSLLSETKTTTNKILQSVPHLNEDVKVILKDLHIDYLSYSQIQTFNICPLHFKLRYLMKLPTAPSASLSFGMTIHETLDQFYRDIKSDVKPTEELILELLESKWKNEGYLNKKHEIMMKEKGIVFLKYFFRNELDLGNLPIVTEQSFLINLKSKNDVESSLKIGGKIDRIDEIGDGKIEIVDYKTGENVPTQKDVDNDMQLSFYALAATRSIEYPFNRKPEDVLLTLYYFEERKRISTKRTLKQLDEVAEKIFEIRGEIEKSEFNCTNEFMCRDCEYKQYCQSNSNGRF